jgi:hypothetical protein
VALPRKVYQLVLLVIATTLLLINQNSIAAIGTVSEQSGPTEIVRKSKSIESKVNSSIEMLDTVVTAKSKVMLTFEDHTTVKITEQSKLIIDDFVYDNKKGAGKLALKVALGTARYASGQIAKSNPQSVNIQTPTATIAVRGTDFSMTVDELGRSLVVLLPSCDAKSCVTGAIEVSTEVGSVFMNQAYQATLVSSRTEQPTKPLILPLDQANINNLLIVSPPKQLDDQKYQQENKTALDINFLDQDLLKYDALDIDELKRFSMLDINYLDFDLLPNILDESTAALAASQESMLEQKTMLPGYNEGSGLKYGIDENGKLILTKMANHVAQVIVDKEADLVLSITQDGSPLVQKVNGGGTTTITITQK